MNKQHPYIKFTSTYDPQTNNIPFLDLSVTINGGIITTDLYKKETAVVQYLLPSSCHVSHQWKNTIFSLAYRLRRICSSDDTFELRLKELKADLMSRQYYEKFIDEAFARARLIDRNEALKKVESKSKDDRVVFAVTYHPNLPSVSKVVKKHWNVMVNSSNAMKRCFPKPPMVAYRRPKNLREILVRAKVSTRRRTSRLKNGCKPCHRACKLCWFLDHSSTHKCKKTGKQWKINAPIDCQTKNVIYKITCKKCDWFVYIGETERRLCDRIQQHRGYVTQKKF